MVRKSYGAALGALIVKKRKAAGLTQTQLAEDALGSASKARRISELENGSVANPHPNTTNPIIHELKISQQELEQCAHDSDFTLDENLDRAYREARNLITVVAARFEHNNPDASLVELEDYLQMKSREWSDLREKIDKIAGPTKAINELKARASEALNQGELDAVDNYLRDAEETQQNNKTIEAIRVQFDIRISRGDNSLIKGDEESAKSHYIAAANYFKYFDERRSVDALNDIARTLFDISKRYTTTYYHLAEEILNHSFEFEIASEGSKAFADTNFCISLLYDDAYSSKRDASFLERAETASRKAIDAYSVLNLRDHYLTARAALGGLLIRRVRLSGKLSDAEVAVEFLRALIVDLPGYGGSDRSGFFGGVYSNLGVALSLLSDKGTDSNREILLDEEIAAFEASLKFLEDAGDFENWGAVSINYGASLNAKCAYIDGSLHCAITRIRAIFACSSGIEVYSLLRFPHILADGYVNLGKTLVEHGDSLESDLRTPIHARALQAFGRAISMHTAESSPELYAPIMLRIAGIHANNVMDEREDLRKHARAMCREAFANAEQSFRSIANIEAADNCASLILELDALEQP